MKYLALIVAGFTLLPLHSMAQEVSDTEWLKNQLQSNFVKDRIEASNFIYGAGIESPELYEAVSMALKRHDPKALQFASRHIKREVASHVKALGGSGNVEYMPLLEEFTKSSSRSIRKYARAAKEMLVSLEGEVFWDSSRVIVKSGNYISQIDYIDELRELAGLRDEGILTEQEFAIQKKKLLEEN